MTSIMPPAPEYVRQNGDLLRQLGAAKVEATDAFTVTATYFHNEKAVNAEALLKDTVWGAKLVVDNQSRTMDAPTVSAFGIENLLRGVAGLDVAVLSPRGNPGQGHPSIIVSASSPDATLVGKLQELVNTRPTPSIEVAVYHKPAAEPAG